MKQDKSFKYQFNGRQLQGSSFKLIEIYFHPRQSKSVHQKDEIDENLSSKNGRN